MPVHSRPSAGATTTPRTGGADGEADGDAVERVAVDEVRRPVDGIDEPRRRVLPRRPFGPRLLPHERAWRLPEALAEKLLGVAIVARHELRTPLVLRRRVLTPSDVDEGRRFAGGVEGDREELDAPFVRSDVHHAFFASFAASTSRRRA